MSHCKVAGVIGTETHFELLLPETWNGKFVMGGGGGFVSLVQNTSLMFGFLQKGYATVGTDTGHQGHPVDASWAYNHLERLVSCGHQAVHRTAVTAKALIRDYYQDEIRRSCFTGCSRGGGQGFLDGLEDGILNDPRQCSFDVGTLLCQGEKTDGCLSEEELATVRVVYDGPNNSQGRSLYHGFPFGGATAAGGWSRWLTGGLKAQESLFQWAIMPRCPTDPLGRRCSPGFRAGPEAIGRAGVPRAAAAASP